MKTSEGYLISASNIDDYILERKRAGDKIITWTPHEWSLLGAYLTANGFSVEFMGIGHNKATDIYEEKGKTQGAQEETPLGQLEPGTFQENYYLGY